MRSPFYLAARANGRRTRSKKGTPHGLLGLNARVGWLVLSACIPRGVSLVVGIRSGARILRGGQCGSGAAHASHACNAYPCW